MVFSTCCRLRKRSRPLGSHVDKCSQFRAYASVIALRTKSVSTLPHNSSSYRQTVASAIKYTDLQIVCQFDVAKDLRKQIDINAAYGRKLGELTAARWRSQLEILQRSVQYAAGPPCARHATTRRRG
jgi:hypothetical protein